jgi:virginiamycin A acetyltransferase
MSTYKYMSYPSAIVSNALKLLWGAPKSKEDCRSSSQQIVTGLHTDLRHAELIAEGKNIIGDSTKMSGFVSLGYGSTIGRSNNLFGGRIEIGRYCQFGPSVGIYAMNHPYTHITTYLNKQLFDGRLKQHQEKRAVQIGHDVWIGHGAIILPDVNIGNGAVVGAGAVVTKDVREYSIVVGNPARELKIRFSPTIVGLLKELKWWELSPLDLEESEELFHLDLVQDQERAEEALRRYLARRKNGKRCPTDVVASVHRGS